MNLNNKRVLLTGASGGIGKAIARALIAQGAQLIMVGRHQQRLFELFLELDLNPIQHLCHVADLNKAAERQSLIDRCRELEGGIHVLINAAGTSHFGLFDQTDPGAIEAMIHTNLIAPMSLTRGLLPLLTQHSEAAVINIGSAFGSIGYPGFANYCASKFGLRGFSEALRRELADSALDVHYIAPRATRTSMNSDAVCRLNAELGNAMDDPQVVADAVLRSLAKAGGRNTYIGWPERLFVKINALLPSVVDSSLARQLAVVKRYATRS